MSFFAFNQLYGQWHIMSRADLRPNVKDRPKTSVPENRTDGKKAEVNDPEKEQTVEAASQAVPENPTAGEVALMNHVRTYYQDTETPEKSPESNSTEDPNLVDLMTLLKYGFEPQASDAKEDAKGKEVGDNESEENLEEIEYLHLPSESLQKLEERIKNSVNARRKFRLWKETMGMCVYCGKHINALDYVTGVDSDIEHIIPQAIGGPSTFENLVCSCRKCNRAKGDRTAMDYVLTLEPKEQAEFLNLLRLLVSSRSISKEKYFNLLRPVMLVNFDTKPKAK